MCVYSNKFLGSSYSTYSVFILRMRRFYPTIAVYNTTVSTVGTNGGLPLTTVTTHQPILLRDRNFSTYHSDCDPFRPESHRTPC